MSDNKLAYAGSPDTTQKLEGKGVGLDCTQKLEVPASTPVVEPVTADEPTPVVIDSEFVGPPAPEPDFDADPETTGEDDSVDEDDEQPVE